MIYIYAFNIDFGGGAVLLKSLLTEYAEDEKITVYINTDIFLNDKFNQNIEIIKYHRSFLFQIFFEWRLRNHSNKSDVALFFSSKPPLFRIKAKTFTFVQNRFVVEVVSSNKKFTLKTLKFYFLRKYFVLFKKNSDYFIVQNFSMLTLMKKLGIKQGKIFIIPFVPKLDLNEKEKFVLVDEYSFIYPADFSGHKNHIKLIEAWYQLAADGFFPGLYLTINVFEYEEILSQIKNHATYRDDIRIHLLGYLDRDQLLSWYKSVDALVYPSLFESFGIPIIEAHQLGLDIIGGETDYMRDLPIKISETFDPHSAISINRAICRYCGYQVARLNLLTSGEFLNQISICKD